MIFRTLSQALLALLIGAAVSPAWSQMGGEQLASYYSGEAIAAAEAATDEAETNAAATSSAFSVDKVRLTGAEGITAIKIVRTNSWVADLDVQDSSDYLLILNLPREGEAELHIIPVQELKETRWTELPAWLPYIGTIPATPTGP